MAERTKSLALALIVAVVAFLLCGCATAASNGDDQVVKAAVELAEEYRSRGRLEEAIDVYDRALNQIYDYRLLYNKALLTAYSGDYEHAALLCQEGFENFPHVLAFKKAQAKYYIELERLNDAASSYLEVLELDPYVTATRKELISLYTTMQEQEKAVEQATILWNQGYRTSEVLGLMKSPLNSPNTDSSNTDSSKED